MSLVSIRRGVVAWQSGNPTLSSLYMYIYTYIYIYRERERERERERYRYTVSYSDFHGEIFFYGLRKSNTNPRSVSVMGTILSRP